MYYPDGTAFRPEDRVNQTNAWQPQCYHCDAPGHIKRHCPMRTGPRGPAGQQQARRRPTQQPQRGRRGHQDRRPKPYAGGPATGPPQPNVAVHKRTGGQQTLHTLQQINQHQTYLADLHGCDPAPVTRGQRRRRRIEMERESAQQEIVQLGATVRELARRMEAQYRWNKELHQAMEAQERWNEAQVRWGQEQDRWSKEIHHWLARGASQPQPTTYHCAQTSDPTYPNVIYYANKDPHKITMYVTETGIQSHPARSLPNGTPYDAQGSPLIRVIAPRNTVQRVGITLLLSWIDPALLFQVGRQVAGWIEMVVTETGTDGWPNCYDLQSSQEVGGEPGYLELEEDDNHEGQGTARA